MVKDIFFKFFVKSKGFKVTLGLIVINAKVESSKMSKGGGGTRIGLFLFYIKLCTRIRLD